MRVEEVEDSEAFDDESGADVDSRYGGRRFASDELHFTGYDLGVARRRRAKAAYDEDSDIDDEEYDLDGKVAYTGDMQIALREKEDLLVERALERMRRARELGKTKVKLTRAEIDALERAERRQILAATPAPKLPKSKRPVQTRPKLAASKQRGSGSSANSPALKAIEPRKRGQSTSGTRKAPETLPYAVLPDEPYGPGSGALMYAPQGYYGPPAVRPNSSNSRSGSRHGSNQSLRQQQSHTPPIPQHQHPYQQGRYFSNPDVYQTRPLSERGSFPRPDPSDPSWEPRARSSSSLVSYPMDRFDQAAYAPQGPAPPRFDPNHPRFASPTAPRMASGPPDMYVQQPIYRQPQDELFLPGTGTPATEDDTEDSEDAGMRVEVLDEPDGSYGVVTRASANASAGNRGRGGGATKKAPARRTR